MEVGAILWRRVDVSGYDTCRLERRDGGWRLQGNAAFRDESGPSCLSYRVDCDERFATRTGRVRGWVGDADIDLRIERSQEGIWTLDDDPVPDLEDCIDLDLGFTPATNLLSLRRIGLQIGQAAHVPVAWIDIPDRKLERLEQIYERRTEDLYWYESIRFDYRAMLRVRPIGFVEEYPGLWEALP